MNKWFKRSIILALVGILVIVLLCLICFLDTKSTIFFSEFRIYWVGLTILFIGFLFIVFGILAWFMGAKPVLDKELLGKE